MQRIMNQIIPFILFGIGIVAFVFGIMLFAYLFFFGALIGLVLFMINFIRNKFFPPKVPVNPKKTSSGRIIDSNDWKNI